MQDNPERRILNRWKIGSAAALVAGVGLTIDVVFQVGPTSLRGAVDPIGIAGFLIYSAFSILVFIPLGLAWWALAPELALRRVGAFIWGRLLRESAADILPFSQMGGIVIGVRVLGQRGIGESLVVASLIADLTAEMAAQLVYTVFGAIMLAAAVSSSAGARDLKVPILVGLAIGVFLLAAFVTFQRMGIDLLGGLVSRWIKDTHARVDAVKTDLRQIYAAPLRLTAGFGLHATAWIASGFGSWFALLLMGVHRSLWLILTLESLIAALRSSAFMLPGGLGVQEGAYVLLAPIFGLTPETALALSLIKRAKDVSIGVCALLAWQIGEGRRIVRGPARAIARSKGVRR